MAKIIYNKNVAKPSDVTTSVFSNEELKYGEIVLCNSIDEPGIYIFTKNDGGETRIQKVNSVKNIVLDSNVDPAITGGVASGDSLSTIVSKLQNQINNISGSSESESEKVEKIVVGVGLNDDGTYKAIIGRHVADATSIADAIAKLSGAIDTVSGETLGKLQGQINAMDKTASSATGQFVRTVVEADGKVTEQKSYIVADDVKITAATASEVTSLGANVKEAWKIVNQEGTRLGDFVKIYKDSSIAEIYLGTSADTVNATTGAIDKKSGDKESLNYVYYTSGGTYSITHIDLETFLTEPEFKSGVTVTNHIAHGVVSGNSESVVTAYTATGGANGTAKVLGVDGGGFYVNNIQTAINAKVNSAISLLDSSSATTSAGYYMTGITITDGKVTAIGQAQLSAQETELSTGNSTTATGNVVTGLSVSDHAITLNKKNFPEVAWKRVTAGGTNIDAATTADTISVVTGNTAITLAGDATNKKITISHTDTSSQASIDAGAGKFIKSVSVDTYGHVTGLTTGDTVNSATTAADSAKVAGKTVGNANGNVPLSNGTVNTKLNADMVDGKHVAVVSAIPSTPDANTIYILA